MPSNPAWMSSKEVAAMLGVTRLVVYKMIDNDGLPAYQMGRVICLARCERAIVQFPKGFCGFDDSR
jgi:excisionase family DNA binding protein